MIGEGQHGGCNEQDWQVPSKDGFVKASVSLGKMCGANVCDDVNPACANQFKVLRDMLVNYPSSEGESSSQTNSPSASRIPESPLNIVEEWMNMSVRSFGKGVLVYSRREKLGMAKLDVDVRSESALLAGSSRTIAGGSDALRSC